MTAKIKKAKGKKGQRRPGKVARLKASTEEELMSLAEGTPGPESRWDRPRKRRISLRVDEEVLDWFQSKGSGYQTRMNRVLRRVMQEGKRRAEEQ